MRDPRHRTGLIVNPRGIAGSGKTELVRRVLAACGQPAGLPEAHGADRDPRRLLHLLPHPAGGQPLALVGAYRGRRAGSGCDGVRQRDGGLAAALRLAGQAAAAGHDVLLEGLALSWEYRLSAALARDHRLHVIRLATPREASVGNLLARRRAGRATASAVLAAAAVQEEALDLALSRLAPVAPVEMLAFDDALSRILDLLGLDTAGAHSVTSPRAERRVARCRSTAPSPAGWDT